MRVRAPGTTCDYLALLLALLAAVLELLGQSVFFFLAQTVLLLALLLALLFALACLLLLLLALELALPFALLALLLYLLVQQSRYGQRVLVGVVGK